MKLRDVLGFSSLAQARVVAAQGALDREVRWSHVVDLPDPAPWVRPGDLLLTTGYSWPASEEEERRQTRSLAQAGVAAVALAVPKYIDRFSDAARDEAERAGVPLLEIPFEIPFAQIMEELHRAIMAEPYRIIERSEAIHRELTRVAGGSATLDDLASALAGLLGRSVTFEDPHGKLLAFASVDEGDAVRKETLARAQSSDATIGALERSGLAAQIRDASGPLRIPPLPEIGMTARVVAPIRLGAELVGVVWIIEGKSALSELDHRAAEHASIVAAMHIAHQRSLEAVESRLGYASLLSFLDSESQTPLTEERLRLLGLDVGAPHRVAIAVLDEELPLAREQLVERDRIAERIAAALRGFGIVPLIAVSLNRIAFLLPAGATPQLIDESLSDEALSIVLGREHAGTEGLRQSYREALSLLTYRYRGRLCKFDDVLVPRVLSGDAKARETFLGDLFGALRSRKNGKELASALLALARHGFRFGATAQALGIHANTLRYRLDRATEILKLDLDDPEIQFRLALAARLLDLENRDW
ncbi:MAG: PucR family transcriptional regulator ligand-binding domain-containing protein [Candidatus Eremiobacteraeota bacterium]|nr:PucR family transcriptional regulator ligand-binding domain-containing protein [Candidatus Eremiobacteraeota bacterium]